MSGSIAKSSQRGFPSESIAGSISRKQLQDKCHELHTEGVFASFHKMQQLNETWDQIDHFTVSCLLAWALNESEAGGDLALIETSLLFSC